MKATDYATTLTEAQFQQKVIDRARANGWLVYHTYDSRHSEAGFPDLVLVRQPELLFVEVKSEKGKTTPAQKAWLFALRGVPGAVGVYVWRPSDWPTVCEVLE